MAMMYLFLLLIQLGPILWLTASAFKSGQDPPVTLPGCNKTCGGVVIPYPFGIGPNCSHNIDYEIICNTSFHTPRPFLRKFNLEVSDITWPGPRVVYGGTPQLLTVRTHPQAVCVSRNGVNNVAPSLGSIDLGKSPYRFSTQLNVFTVQGCSGIVILKDRKGKTLAGCASVCLSNNDDRNMSICETYGVGCCQKSLPSSIGNLDFYQIGLSSDGTTASTDLHACHMRASLADATANFSWRLPSLEPLPTILEWSGTDVPTNKLAVCYSSKHDRYCYCSTSYQGNPYLSDGCEDGDYYDTVKNPWLKRGLILGLSIGIGLPLLLTAVYCFHRYVKRMMELKQKAKYFKRNGGLLLQQEISSKENVVEKARIFSVSELEKATDSFNKNRILGQGGQGTVYKGMMADGKIVAVKKSKKVDESQLEQFINEVVILSQVNHRNVVKLLGCCLETEVPLLVYEFIPNGTLYHHIHDPSEDFQVTWKMRLQIAAESASALAYLHSSSYPPVYHRDIKSTNILLDDKYRAKVSDFGTSKVITIDQTHVTTCVQGTYGYLDPEYFQSNQFTEKSDVYSFGVVLVELITGKKPICPTKTRGWISLASEFLFHIESSSLHDILDTRVVNEENKEEFMAVAKLASQCLKMNGRRRPTMKEVAMELDGIRSQHVKNSTQSSYAETNQVQGSHLGISISFPDNSIASCFSIDAEPLIANSC